MTELYKRKRIPGLLILILLLTSSNSFGQSSRRYVKIIIEDATTSEAAGEIDAFMRAQPGVITSRMDRSTSMYLGIYSSSTELSVNNFLQWIESLGYSTSCYVEDDLVPGVATTPLTVKDCANNAPIELKQTH